MRGGQFGNSVKRKRGFLVGSLTSRSILRRTNSHCSSRSPTHWPGSTERLRFSATFQSVRSNSGQVQTRLPSLMAITSYCPAILRVTFRMNWNQSAPGGGHDRSLRFPPFHMADQKVAFGSNQRVRRLSPGRPLLAPAGPLVKSRRSSASCRNRGSGLLLERHTYRFLFRLVSL